MIAFRPYHNSDTPQLAEIWRSQPPLRAIVQPMSAQLFEEVVLAKPYFNREGLIVATDDGAPVGFVHVGFGPNEAHNWIATDKGVISMVMVSSVSSNEELAAQLLQQGEQYLAAAGVKRILAGGYGNHCPFYVGLYGGSRLPGVLESDPQRLALFKSAGYEEQKQILVFQRDVAGFRPPMDRKQIQVRRGATVEMIVEPVPADWWQACNFGTFEQFRFELTRKADREVVAHVTFWNMEMLAATWGRHACGLIDIWVDPKLRRQGYATFLIGESIRQLQQQQVSLVEFQVVADNPAAASLVEDLGFAQIDRGFVLDKEVG